MKKEGTTIRVAIGKPIMPEEYAHIEDLEELGRFFKAKTYELKKDWLMLYIIQQGAVR